MVCSFCGKYSHEVISLIQGPGVSICNECVLACNETLFEALGEAQKINHQLHLKFNGYFSRKASRKYKDMWE